MLLHDKIWKCFYIFMTNIVSYNKILNKINLKVNLVIFFSNNCLT